MYRHLIDQLDCLDGALVHVDVWILVAGEHAVECVGHALGHVAVQIEARGHGDGLANGIPHGNRKITFEIGQPRDDAGTVQVEVDAIKRKAGDDPLNDLVPESLVCLPADRAGWLSADGKNGHGLDAKRTARVNGATDARLGAFGTQDRGTTPLTKLRGLSFLPAVRVRLVGDAGDSDPARLRVHASPASLGDGTRFSVSACHEGGSQWPSYLSSTGFFELAFGVTASPGRASACCAAHVCTRPPPESSIWTQACGQRPMPFSRLAQSPRR